MAPEFVSLLEGVFFFIELGMYMCISSTQIRDYPTNDQQWKQQRQLHIMEIYNSVMKMNKYE